MLNLDLNSTKQVYSRNTSPRDMVGTRLRLGVRTYRSLTTPEGPPSIGITLMTNIYNWLSREGVDTNLYI